MKRFKIDSIFRIESRREFVFAGEVAEEIIQTGMMVRVPLQEGLYSCIPIIGVEFIRNGAESRGSVGLRFLEESEADVDFYSELCPPGTIVEVVSDE